MGPVDRAISSPVVASTMRSPLRTTAGSSTVDLCVTGKCSACRSMRICPRRIVWHSISPASAATRHWHDRRKRLPRTSRCFSQSGGGESKSIPPPISTMHSLHLPWVMHDVGTRTPACSAAVKRETPTAASIRHPLTVSVAGMKLGDLPVGSALEFELDGVHDFRRRALALLRLAPPPLCQIGGGGIQATRRGKAIHE